MTNTATFALGQRWLSTTEHDLGLGTIVETDHRSVTILFALTGESRVYAKQSAPLTRIQFEQGEQITSHEGWALLIDEVQERQGLLTYFGMREDTGEQAQLKETLLDHHFQFDQADKRLMNGQFDDPKWFDLRQQCILHQHNHATSNLLGLVGARVDLIPHQLHIANEVGRRHAPRVLLADEVGLGKTIEAALIIHQQLLTQKAQRVLIVVPDSLLHQWLVEMLRRVNLAFAIFDQERCAALATEAGNPFETEQLVLCSLDFLTHNSRYYQQALNAEWDLLVVDEAHHLTWNEQQPSQQYQVIQGLADVTKGVLLLTATPDQLGHESHFARLRLLDPARFHNYQLFVEEEKGYAALAKAVTPLLQQERLSDTEVQALRVFAGDTTAGALEDAHSRQKLIHQLLDRHGTGRLLFRNSRAGITGFPQRILKKYSLEMPDIYTEVLAETENVRVLLSPERHPRLQDAWLQLDPRVQWFIDKLQSLKGEKLLTICSSAATAQQLADILKQKAAIRATLFHEGMSIVERDKAANYFAQSEDGAQVLVCSEIGSEGRNFQFSHHLVLFDLPLMPDLLEQRIGRLDRIGQKHDIQIHVPVFANSSQQILLDWYHQGLNAFEQTCPTGTAVYEEMQEQLIDCLFNQNDASMISPLLSQTQALHLDLKSKLEAGRDQLLELNSSGKGRIEALLGEISEAEQSPMLERFMTSLFDALGVLQEEKDEFCYLLRPTESMLTALPGLDEEGMTITYEREAATKLEHVHFFSWDHPMIQHAMEMVTTESLGKSSIALLNDKSLPTGAYWLECLFVLSATAAKQLQLQRFLPPTPIKVCIDAAGKLADKHFIQLQQVNQKVASQLVGALQSHILNNLQRAETAAQASAEQIKATQLDTMQELLGDELSRLLALREVNPSIRDEEIAHVQGQIQALTEAIKSADIQLEAIRLIVNHPQ